MEGTNILLLSLYSRNELVWWRSNDVKQQHPRFRCWFMPMWWVAMVYNRKVYNVYRMNVLLIIYWDFWTSHLVSLVQAGDRVVSEDRVTSVQNIQNVLVQWNHTWRQLYINRENGLSVLRDPKKAVWSAWLWSWKNKNPDATSAASESFRNMSSQPVIFQLSYL